MKKDMESLKEMVGQLLSAKNVGMKKAPVDASHRVQVPSALSTAKLDF